MKKMSDFPITFWHAVYAEHLLDENGRIKRSRLEEMKEAGFNLVLAAYNSKLNCEFLELAHELELEVTVIDERILNALTEQNDDRRRELLFSATEDYKSYPALHSYYLNDEPNSALFDSLRRVRDILLEYDPEHEVYINLFPNYASTEQLGNATYHKYVDEYLTQVKPEILSYDHYHFLRLDDDDNIAPIGNFINDRERMIYEDACKKVSRNGFFDNIEIIRELSLKHNIPFMIIVLLVAHGPYRYLHEGEIRWEAFQSLAYGAKRLSYFTYSTPIIEGDAFWFYREAMLDEHGNRTEHYDMVAEINPEILNIGNIVLDKKSIGVFHTMSTDEPLMRKFEGFGGISKIEGDDATVGFFEGGYVILANKSYDSEAEIILHTDSTLEIYDSCGDEWLSVEASDGKYPVLLDAGDGILLKLINHIKI